MLFLVGSNNTLIYFSMQLDSKISLIPHLLIACLYVTQNTVKSWILKFKSCLKILLQSQNKTWTMISMYFKVEKFQKIITCNIELHKGNNWLSLITKIFSPVADNFTNCLSIKMHLIHLKMCNMELQRLDVFSVFVCTR